jgi:hypothetical protein
VSIGLQQVCNAGCSFSLLFSFRPSWHLTNQGRVAFLLKNIIACIFKATTFNQTHADYGEWLVRHEPRRKNSLRMAGLI